ncbi:glycosyltransferase family 4 protein [Pseudohalioglobus sediminis]|uniref:Glycosyltransferase family 4 protein n=1 Tax=Pseudohalioglobus sediminis TaxID=2606449 RepID=A0A5B0WVN9_9GAMM|nr:glycosyltransferase family 4 protein [Pseudohalioglobus sediminis]KAA1189949.1 glycosyltransferase family 4 protein [Pseudohalioglobus sediminis]
MDRTTIITLSTKGPGGIRTVVENYISVGLYEDYDHHWIATHDIGSVFSRLMIFARSIFQLLRLLPRKPILHIHVASYGSFFRKWLLTLIGKVFGCKVILHLHGSEFKVFYSSASTVTKEMVKSTFHRADVVIVLSESWKAYVLSIADNAEIEVVNNFVPQIPIDAAKSDSSQFAVLFMGKLGERKGVYDLISAVGRIAQQIPDSVFYLCGDGEIEKVNEEIAAAGLADFFSVEGWIGIEDKADYYSKADVFLLPSYNEGLPMSILEAMSSALPLIATPVGGIPEVIESGANGLLVEPGDIDGLAQAILSLFRDVESRNHLGQAALRCYQERYCPEVIVPKLKSIYLNLA